MSREGLHTHLSENEAIDEGKSEVFEPTGELARKVTSALQADRPSFTYTAAEGGHQLHTNEKEILNPGTLKTLLVTSLSREMETRGEPEISSGVYNACIEAIAKNSTDLAWAAWVGSSGDWAEQAGFDNGRYELSEEQEKMLDEAYLLAVVLYHNFELTSDHVDKLAKRGF